MLPTAAIQEIARYARLIPGTTVNRALALREVQYPAEGQTPKYPSLVLLWGETTLTYFAQEQYWDMNVRGLLLTGLVNETKHEIAVVDPLIALVVDCFDASSQNAFILMNAASTDHTDGCQVTTVAASQQIGYGGLQHYGAELTFNVKMRRFANG